MKKHQSGFTLIELVLVIVILGILAAVAMPRFGNMNSEARRASLSGMMAGVQSASAIAHATALAQNQTEATGTVTLEGRNVDLVFGYPAGTQTGIVNAFSSTQGYNPTSTGGVTTFTQDSAATCTVTYTAPTAAGNAPTITRATDAACS